MPKKLLFVYFGLILIYAFFSYALTDPNLVLTSWPPYWQWQGWMWRTLFENAPLLTYSFIALVSGLSVTYLLLIKNLQKLKAMLSAPTLLVALIVVIAPLLLSYNALSHDVFNYIFNAKMVAVYHANPHLNVPLDFANDEWVRFMHNTHTPAPYGYGWTVFSLLPYEMGMGKFLPTWLLFRGMSLVSVLLLWWSLHRVAKWRDQKLQLVELAILFLNPLFLLEIISNSHNDLWMMIPAVLSLGLMASPQRSIPQWFRNALISLGLLGLSISIKFASLLLMPIWVGLVLGHMVTHHKVKPLQPLAELATTYWPLAASLLMFLPLLTERAQQFHPWYLTWVLAWLPLFKEGENKLLNRAQSLWKLVVVGLSFSSLYRYVPWLWAGNFDGDVLTQQKMITWLGGAVAVLILLILTKLGNFHKKPL